MTSESNNKVETLPVAHRAAPAPVDYTPRTLPELMQWAETAAASGLVPKDYVGKPQAVVIAAQYGAEVGLKPLQAIQNIAVINGRPGMWGDAMLALVRSSGLLEWIKEEETDDYGSCTVKRRGDPEPQTVIFSTADAKAAGLIGKQGPWSQYRKRMMKLRARGFVLRDVFPDVLRGLVSAEELRDIEGTVVEAGAPIEQPRTDAKPDKVQAMKEKLKKNRQAGLTLDEVKRRLALAADADTLQALIKEIAEMADPPRQEAAALWKARVQELKAQAAAATTADAPAPEGATDDFTKAYDAADPDAASTS